MTATEGVHDVSAGNDIQQRLQRLLETGDVQPYEILKVHLDVLTDWTVDPRLREIFNGQLETNLDGYLAAAEQRSRRATLTRGVAA